MNILVMGPPGSGKSTQAELLSQKLDLFYIQMGQEVRRAAQEDSQWGRKIKKQMEKGALIDDNSVKRLLKRIVLSDKCKQGFVLDGAPRKMSQVDGVERIIEKAGGKISVVVLVKVSDEECLRRLLKRGRQDDTEEVIKDRLNLYHQKQGPVIDYFKKKGLLVSVDGEREIKVILEDILARLKQG